MRWKSGRRSSNVDDRRGVSRRAGGGAGLFLLLRFLPRLLASKAGRMLLLVGVVGLAGAHFLGVDVLSLLGGGQTGSQQQAQPQRSAAEDELAEFVAVVLADTETTWHAQFEQLGQTYQEPKLVLFTDFVRSACGAAQAAMGPFYCPADQTVYIDLAFYSDLKNRHDAPGDFAQAYVVAHEVGHHVQTLLGISAQVRKQQQNLSQSEGNQLSVKQELQADCFAGLWAHSANVKRQLLEPGDIDEALTAAAAIGDDRLQQQTQGHAKSESFTHGTSAQRSRWFKRGFEHGELAACDTFSAAQL